MIDAYTTHCADGQSADKGIMVVGISDERIDSKDD
jgi:hypothetical protein